jgi:hypothetical protein
MATTDDKKTTCDEICSHFRMQEIQGECYLLLCKDAPVTVLSQQIRALNLAYALHGKESISGKRIAVIGAGAAGLTFAAASAILGAKWVRVFEKSSQPFDLQRGSWHRPLHPEIFTWPKRSAWLPVSRLPLFGWTTGRAHNVAGEMVAKFELVCAKVNAEAIEKGIVKEQEELLKVCCHKQATVNHAGEIIVDVEQKKFDVVVLAVGFGIEENPFDLPWNSYWRVDTLDQSLLGESRPGPRTVVVGGGEGALIEIVRSCIQSYDLGALLGQVLTITLGDDQLRDEILSIEKLPTNGGDLLQHYRDLNTHSARKLRDILWEKRREGAVVTWLIDQKQEQAFVRSSLPINRFLVGQLRRLSAEKTEFLEAPRKVDVTDVMRGNGFYVVRFLEGKEHVLKECDNAVVRYGAQKEPPRTGVFI